MSDTHFAVSQSFNEVKESATTARYSQWIGLHFILQLLPVFLYVANPSDWSSNHVGTVF
jgi:hypothetical protein